MYKSGNGSGDQRKVLSTPAGTPAVGYTAEELQRMKSALNRKLGPEFISKRKGPGFSSVQYLEGWKAINLANDIFGPNGWCTELKEFKVDYIDDRHGAISMGLSCIVRVILKDGTFHEDIGYGSIDNCKNKAAAFDKCKKEAFTDGMKRALRQFGNALGNCLYDKEFLQQITKVTSEPNDFDANALLRRSTTLPKVFAPNAMTRHEDYQEEGIKREDTLKPIRGQTITPNVASVPKKDVKNDKTVASTAGPAPVRQLSPRKSRDDGEDSFMFSDDWPEDDEVNNQILKSNNYEKEQLPESDFEFDEVHEGGEVSVASVADKTATSGEKMKPPMEPMNTSDEPTAVANTSRISTPIPDKVTFVSATSADTIQQDPTLQTSLKFDVRATGSQIAKSSFINHSKSLPVKRSLLQTSTVSANRNVQRGKPLQSHGTRPLGLGNNHNVNVSTNANNAITGNNPLAKRAFGLPPDRADGKRLRK